MKLELLGGKESSHTHQSVAVQRGRVCRMRSHQHKVVQAPRLATRWQQVTVVPSGRSCWHSPKKTERNCHGGQGECLTFSLRHSYTVLLMYLFNENACVLLTSTGPESLVQPWTACHFPGFCAARDNSSANHCVSLAHWVHANYCNLQ